jgi:hypothetical protein
MTAFVIRAEEEDGEVEAFMLTVNHDFLASF